MTAKFQFLKILLNDIENDQAGDISMRTDKSCLDQIVYNLVNNAHKYACSGSNIYVSFDKIEEQSFGELSVINYGIDITEDQEKPYQLYFRGINDKEYEDGTGIGLYVSQQIATKRLQSRINHTCEWISNWYVPFMEPYLERDFVDEPIDKKNRIKAELQNLKHNGLYDEIISGRKGLFDMSFSDQKIKEKIDNPTYRVIFTMTIKNFRKEIKQ
jgi:hypothetical protein